MLFALAGLALFGLWWLGRNGGRLPSGLKPHRIAGYALIAIGALLALRGSFLFVPIAAACGIWLLQGSGKPLRNAGGLFEQLRDALRGGPARPARVERTILLEPERNPDGAPVDALVLAGSRTGFRLSQLDEADLWPLLALCRNGDLEGTRFLEAYLDRRLPGWRVDAQRDADARSSGTFQPGAMTEEEAYQILGLERGASLDRVRAKHRSLMKSVHPDQGGSAEAAARLNAARDRLTNRHR